MLQQPTGATGLGVLGQSAHRQFGLLPVRTSDVGIGHSVYGREQVQHSPRGLQPARPLQHTELVLHTVPCHHAQHNPTGLQKTNPGLGLGVTRQDLLARGGLAYNRNRRGMGWQHVNHCALSISQSP